MIHEKQIKFVPKSWIFVAEVCGSVIQQLACRVKVVQHHLPIFCNRRQQRFVASRSLVVPHLKNVDDLADVVA